MSRRSWLNPNGPSGRPLSLVNPINAPETGNEIWVPETPLPIATLGRFFEFLANHTLSNGQLTTIPTLSPSDVTKFMTPYNDWAPPPYNNNSVRSDTGMNRFSMCFTGFAALLDFETLFTGGGFSDIVPANIDFELEMCRQRLWAGMVPISDRRWAEKKLHAPENIDLATCDMVHFSLPETSRKMRRAYNKAYDACATSTPHVKFITNRIHTWAATHVDRLHEDLMHRIQSRAHSPWRNAAPRAGCAPHAVRAPRPHDPPPDETILIPLVASKNTLPHWRHATSPPMVDWPAYIRSHGATPLEGNYPADIRQRDEVVHQRMANLVRHELTHDQEMQRNADAVAAAGNVGAFSGENTVAPLRAVRRAYAQARRELRGEAEPVREELWVAALRRSLEPRPDGGAPMHTKWGFVAYRLWYGHSDEQWATFLRKFDADVNNWGAGVAGAEAVRDKLEIRWVDGRDHGIAEGDVEGARKHFKSLNENKGAGLHGLNAPAFLVADQDCIQSYIQGFKLPGQTLLDEMDTSPFILVGMDEPADGSSRKAPGFEGTVKVLGSVLLLDVWPLLWWRLAHLEDLWNLATWHPWCAYVGPVVQSQVEGWNQFKELMIELFKKADEWRRQGRLTGR
ncbi:hypothetical protein NEMBOFW57_001268 [Staphylotrichum longicolle]|uniref:Uncharacterized protein n=1 Tax=Staphylotrichum longicolle TaxID=669026 RepID=A0AAD4I1K1_9PEZI|nr:hypothetical protein NEMBOFW57_001268 [Staphylotrichum longicolle]